MAFDSLRGRGLELEGSSRGEAAVWPALRVQVWRERWGRGVEVALPPEHYRLFGYMGARG